MRASDYPGSIRLIAADDLVLAGSAGTAAIERAGTSLSSTRLGSGKEKLFLRAVGDSSFSGQTQATVGQYFGEARINYSAPDPDLRLYDVARTEIVLGPQGLLYGAGALGGIIRVEPNRPDFEKTEVAALLSTAATSHGEPGAEAAAILNIPLRRNDMAVRVVGYHVRGGGFIDNVARDMRDLNRTEVTGARAFFALSPATAWNVEIGGILQNIDGGDAVYVESERRRLENFAASAQPYLNRFRLGSATVRHEGADISATASLSLSRGRVGDRFDAVGAGVGTNFLSRENVSNVFAGEMRLRNSGIREEGWLVGTAFVDSRARFATALHYNNRLPMARETRTHIMEQTIFGQVSRRVGPILLSIGARALRWKGRSRSPSSRTSAPDGFEIRDRGWGLVPSLSALVTLPGELQLFLRHGSSYRPPAASASPGGVVSLSGDRYRALETGLRLPREAGGPVDGEISLSIGRWHNVQADIMDNTGFLSASNIGNARTISIDATLAWQLSDRFNLRAGFTANEAWIIQSAPTTIIAPKGRLPNIPDVNALLGLRFGAAHSANIPWQIASTVRYVGRSRLGIGPLLDRSQGGYAELNGEAVLDLGTVSFFMKVDNLLGGQHKRFALGSIGQIGIRDQSVPQAPRTLTIGFKLK